MAENTSLSDFQGDGGQDVMVAAYRHDAHKMNGQPHDYAPETFAGVSVNQTVPHGADGDASALSRPNGKPEQTMDNHETLYRLSLIEGKSRYDPQEFTRNGVESAVRPLLTEDDPAVMHRAWLESDVVSAFNESVYYPYTSLKYHTLLVAALLDNYRDGHEFGDLLLVVDRPGEIVPHRLRGRGLRASHRRERGQTTVVSPRESPVAVMGFGVEQADCAPARHRSRQVRHGTRREPPSDRRMVHRAPVHRGLPGGVRPMTRIQQVQWELEMDYIGHPYYVSGNAIMHALGQQLPHDVHRHLNASHGVFVLGQFGTFPEEHSQSGTRPYLGSGLPYVESYDDLFLMRQASHSWLLDSRPRDALNTHDIRVQSGHPALSHKTIMGKPDGARKQQQTTKWYINAYLHADRDDILPLDESVLDGLQFGGKRNYGYGITRLKDTQVVDLATLDYSRLEDGEAFILELVTPFVLESEYPNAHDQDVPWWWSGDDEAQLRHRLEKVIEGGDVYELETVDHGVVVGYDGDCPVETAISGITRVGNHSKYGFGELRVKTVTPDETNLKNQIEKPNSEH